MKKIFLDCGTHTFQGFKTFAEKYSIDSTWKCFCFEANPYTFAKSKPIYQELINKGYNITHFNKAVSDNNEIVKVNCAIDNSEYINQGSNILKQPPSIDKVYGGTYTYSNDEHFVESINFPSFLKETCLTEDFVVIKMDIEGSEFAVLDEMINTDVIYLIDDIYVEFHERFFDDIKFYENKKIKYKTFFESKGIKLNDWI